MAEWRELPPLLTIAGAAKLLGVTRQTMYRWTNTGVVPVRQIGGRRFVPSGYIEAQAAWQGDREDTGSISGTASGESAGQNVVRMAAVGRSPEARAAADRARRNSG